MQLTHDTRLTAAQPLDLGRPAAILLARLRVWTATHIDALAARRTRGQELRQLARYTDRELRDLGLSRTDFVAIAEGSFRRD